MTQQPSALVIPAGSHAGLKAHLFPGDGFEAAAILLCSRSPGRRKRMLAPHLILVPHGDCATRTPDYISGPGRYLEEAIDRGEADGLSIMLLHSHPGGFVAFSRVDDTTMPIGHLSFKRQSGPTARARIEILQQGTVVSAADYGEGVSRVYNLRRSYAARPLRRHGGDFQHFTRFSEVTLRAVGSVIVSTNRPSAAQ